MIVDGMQTAIVDIVLRVRMKLPEIENVDGTDGTLDQYKSTVKSVLNEMNYAVGSKTVQVPNASGIGIVEVETIHHGTTRIN